MDLYKNEILESNLRYFKRYIFKTFESTMVLILLCTGFVACGTEDRLCEIGALTCSCFENGLCDGDLICSSGICTEDDTSTGVPNNNLEIETIDPNSDEESTDSGWVHTVIDSGQVDEVDPEMNDSGDVAGNDTDSGTMQPQNETDAGSEITQFCEEADTSTVSAEYADLGLITDKDDEGGQIFDNLDGADDQDWFRYLGSDNLFAYADPYVKITASRTVQMCMFISCPSADETEFSCPDGSNQEISDLNYKGCCISGATRELHIEDLDCGGDENAEVYLLVRSNPEEMCLEYRLDYNY